MRGCDGDPRPIAAPADVFAQAQLQLTDFALDIVLEHELAIRPLASLDARRVAEGRQVRGPSHSRVAMAFDEWDLLARNCERARVLGAAFVFMVGRLVEVLHVGVVAEERQDERPDPEDRDPKCLEALPEQLLAALVLSLIHI